MVTVEQVRMGLANFLDQEVVPALPGWKQVVVGGWCTLSLANPDTIKKALESPYVKAMGIVMPNGMIDIDKAKAAFLPRIRTQGSMDINIPFIGKVGIGEAEVETLYRMITGG